MTFHRARRAVGIAAMLVASAAVPAGAEQFALTPHQTAIGALTHDITRESDTMMDIARRHDIGFAEFMAANPGINPWVPGDGKVVVVPGLFILPDAPHIGIVINLGERRLFYFHPDKKTVETFPIGIGVDEGMTPIGTTTVVWKEPNPTWYPPASIRAEEPDLPAAIPPGPDDPLGAFALHLGWTNFLIHGTNKPDGVGRNVSHGCIRMYPEDIDRLFHEVAVGTPVRTVDQPVLVGWIDGQLYAEVHPSRDQVDQIDVSEPMTPRIPDNLVAQVTAAAGDHEGQIDWDAVERAGLARTGTPIPVTTAILSAKSIPSPASSSATTVQRAKPDIESNGNIIVDRGPYVLPAVPPNH